MLAKTTDRHGQPYGYTQGRQRGVLSLVRKYVFFCDLYDNGYHYQQ